MSSRYVVSSGAGTQTSAQASQHLAGYPHSVLLVLFRVVPQPFSALGYFGSFQPYGVAYNAAGDIAVSDVTNNRVLMLRTGDTVPTVIAGGTGTLCGVGVDFPIGLAFDGAGSLAIADYNNSRVVFCNLTTGVVTTYAGGGQLFGPWGIAFDSAGNLAVADQLHDRVVLLTPGIATGTFSSIAGSAVFTQGSSGDGGPAASALFNNPAGLAYDAANGLAIVDEVSPGRRRCRLWMQCGGTWAGLWARELVSSARVLRVARASGSHQGPEHRAVPTRRTTTVFSTLAARRPQRRPRRRCPHPSRTQAPSRRPHRRRRRCPSAQRRQPRCR